MELRLCCLRLSSVRPWAQAHVPEVQICRGIISWCFFCAQLDSARLASAWLGLAWRLLLRGLSLGFFSDKKKKRQTSLAWRCDVFLFPFLYCCSHSFVVCLLTSQTHVSAAQGFLWVSLPQRYLHSSIGTAIEIDLLLFSLHICVSFCLLFCVISFILHFVFRLPKMHLQFAHAAYTWCCLNVVFSCRT